MVAPRRRGGEGRIIIGCEGQWSIPAEEVIRGVDRGEHYHLPISIVRLRRGHENGKARKESPQRAVVPTTVGCAATLG